jgi:uncharacterized protein DUF6966
MSASVDELTAVVDDLISLLEADGAVEWVQTFALIRAQLNTSRREAAAALMRIYGGMGSFNDLVVGQTGTGTKPNFRELNQSLDALRTRAWTLARALTQSS